MYSCSENVLNKRFMAFAACAEVRDRSGRSYKDLREVYTTTIYSSGDNVINKRFVAFAACAEVRDRSGRSYKVEIPGSLYDHNIF